MPILTEEELTAAIAAEEIGAITLDTSVFDKYGDDLRNKVLLSLKQFTGTSIKIVFPDLWLSSAR